MKARAGAPAPRRAAARLPVAHALEGNGPKGAVLRGTAPPRAPPSPTPPAARLHVAHALEGDGPKRAVLRGDDPLLAARARAAAKDQGADAVGVPEGDEAHAFDQGDARVGALRGGAGVWGGGRGRGLILWPTPRAALPAPRLRRSTDNGPLPADPPPNTNTNTHAHAP